MGESSGCSLSSISSHDLEVQARSWCTVHRWPHGGSVGTDWALGVAGSPSQLPQDAFRGRRVVCMLCAQKGTCAGRCWRVPPRVCNYRWKSPKGLCA